MKNTKIVSILMVCTLLFAFTGCDKAGSECKAVGDEFMQALIEQDYKDVADFCKDEDAATIMLNRYEENEVVSLFLDNATFEAGKPECSTKDGTGTIEYTLTIPDIDQAYDEAPDDIEELEEMIPNLDTDTLTFKIKFKLKKDDWQITNIDAILEKTYGTLYSYDFGFINYEEVIEQENWYGSTDSEYTGFSTYIEYDIDFTEYIERSFTYSFTYNGDEVKTADYSSTSYMSLYLYASDMDDASQMPAGDYTITVIDDKGRAVTSASCVVNEIDYADIISSDNWYGSDDEPNIYYSSSTYLDYDLYFTEYTGMTATYEYYYNGELVKEDTYSCGSSGYFYLYDDDMVEAGYLESTGSMPIGDYEVKIYDGAGNFITSAEAVVSDRTVNVSSTVWYGASNGNQYYNTRSNLDFDVHFDSYYGGTCSFTYLYEGEVIFESTYSSGSYVYCYMYQTDIEDVLDTSDGFPCGTYEVHVYNASGEEIATDTCEVIHS